MKKLYLPLKDSDILDLVAGEQVYLNGVIYTARDAAHKRFVELMERNEQLPFDIKNQTIYYVGPTINSELNKFESAGPTTSSRMDKFTPILLDNGLKGMIGKGFRSDEVKASIVKNKACYFIAIGGAGALLAKCIKKSKLVAFDDLLSEAVYELYVEDFPVFVGIDVNGNDIYN